MGFFSPEGESHVESIVFFLSEALRSAIEAGDRLQHSVCSTPQIAHGMDTAEMLDRLAGFREQTKQLWGMEMLMLTKILRAGELAKELRPHTIELRPEIDTFRLATVMATDLRNMLMPDADTVFNGAVQPKRFLEARGYASREGAMSRDELSGYQIGGQVDVRLLMDACEALHFTLAGRYGVEAMPLVLDMVVEDKATAIADDSGDDLLLLSDLAEILPEIPSAQKQQRRMAEAVVRH
jgi:hypothetical protein